MYRTGKDGLPPVVLFEYQPGRSGDYPKKFLEGFHWYLHTDGYAGYNKVAGITRCGCWAHLRRKFVDAMPPETAETAGPPSTAQVGRDYCDQLFAAEKKTLSALLVCPNEYPEKVEIGTELRDLQQAVGGTIEAVYPYKGRVALIVNDEGKLNGMPLNRVLRDEHGKIYDSIAGSFLVGLDEDDFYSLSPDLMDQYEALFHQPELFTQLVSKMVVLPMSNQMMEEGNEMPEIENDE